MKSADLYTDSPIRLTILADSIPDTNPLYLSFEVRALSLTKFEIKGINDVDWKTHEFGKVVPYEKKSLFFTYVENELDTEPREFPEVINIEVIPIDIAAAYYSSQVIITKIDKRSSVIELSISDPNIKKTEDILNTLVIMYNLDAIADKNAAAQNTAKFIDERLREVNSDLDSIERGIQSFKNNKRLTDLQVESLIGLESSTGIGREVINVETQIRIALSLKNKLFSNNYEFLPNGLGFEGEIWHR